VVETLETWEIWELGEVCYEGTVKVRYVTREPLGKKTTEKPPAHFFVQRT
jgi:hypothetical protein